MYESTPPNLSANGCIGTLSKSQKKKNKKKNVAKKVEESDKVNGSQAEHDTEDHEDDAEEEEQQPVQPLLTLLHRPTKLIYLLRSL